MMDALGNVHSLCLHWERLLRLSWELLSASGYPYPPLYEGHDFMEGGVRRCSVTLTIPGAPIVIQVVGHRLLDTWETAAMRGIAAFCEAHPISHRSDFSRHTTRVISCDRT